VYGGPEGRSPYVLTPKTLSSFSERPGRICSRASAKNTRGQRQLCVSIQRPSRVAQEELDCAVDIGIQLDAVLYAAAFLVLYPGP
jgi:hypothetical protein